MNDIKSLIRIAFGIIIGYIAITTVIQFIQFFPTFFLKKGTYENPAYGIYFICISIILFGVLVWQFIIKPDKWLKRIAEKTESSPPAANIDWLTGSYRLAAVMAGILLLYYAIFGLSSAASNLLFMKKNSAYDDFSHQMWFYLVAGSLQLIFAIWLLFGAPQLVRWHVKEIRRMAGEKV